jgi:hypothetical protein
VKISYRTARYGVVDLSTLAANNGQQPKSPAQQQCETAQKNAQANYEAINKNFYKKAYKNALEGILIGGLAGCILTAEIGCAEGGLPGAAIGGLSGAAKSMVQDIFWETVDTILANQQCEGVQ